MDTMVSTLTLFEDAIARVQRRELLPERLLDGLGVLATHLDARVFPAHEWELPETALNLTTFVTEGGVPLFAVVLSDFRLAVGRSDRPSISPVIHSFSEVNPQTHELMALIVGATVDTGLGAEIRVQFGPNRGVPASSGNLLQLQRGHIFVEDDKLTVRFEKLREPPGSDQLPSVLVQGDVDADPEGNLLSSEAIRDLKACGCPPDVQAVNWLRGLIVHCRGDGFITRWTKSARQRVEVPPGDHARAMSIYDVGEAPDGGPPVFHAIVADDRRLIVYRHDRATESWTTEPWLNQRVFPDHPRLVAFAGKAAKNQPMLLVAHRDRSLACYEFCDAGTIRTLWERGWAAIAEILTLKTPAEWRDWMRLRLPSSILPPMILSDMPDERLQPIMDRFRSEGSPVTRSLAIFTRIFQNLTGIWSDLNSTEVEQFIALMDIMDEDRAVCLPMQDLLRQLMREVTKTPETIEATHIDRIASTLNQAYEKAAWSVRDVIDVEMKDFDESRATALGINSLRDLLQRASITREMIWRDTRGKQDLQNVLLRATCAIGRKHNAVQMADARKIPGLHGRRMQRAIVNFSLESGSSAKSTTWLTLADAHQIQAVALDDNLHIGLPVTLLQRNLDTQSPIVGLAEFCFGGSQFLVVAYDDGVLSIYRATMSGGGSSLDLALVTSLPVGKGSEHTRGVAAVTGQNETLIALVRDVPDASQHTRVHLLQFMSDTLKVLVHEDVEHVHVQCIDMVRKTDHTCEILIGGGSEACALLCEARPGTPWNVERKVKRTFDSRVFAVRMDREIDARFAAVGERDGVIWGFDLKEEDKINRILWTYRMEGAARDIARIEVHGRPHFAVLMETGRVVLIRAEDGRRVWKRRIGELLFSGCGFRDRSNRGCLAVVQQDGILSIYREITPAEQEDAAMELERLIALPFLRGVPSAENDQRSLKCLDAIVLHSESVDRTLMKMRSRSERMYFLLDLIKRNDPGITPGLARYLTAREISLIHASLDPADARWEPLRAPDLPRDSTPKARRGDNSDRARHAAETMRLRRLALLKPTVAQLARFEVADEAWTDRWFCLEYARTLLATVHREFPHAKDSIEHLLRHLVRLPVRVLYALARVCPHERPLKECIESFAVIARRGSGSGPQPEDDVLQNLSDSLEGVDLQLADALLIRCMLDFHLAGRRVIRTNTPSAHDTGRLRSAFRIFCECVRRPLDEFSFERPLVEALNSVLAPGSFPVSTQRIDLQRGWYQDTQGRADASKNRKLNAIPGVLSPEWLAVHQGLFERAAALIAQVAAMEGQALLHKTRVYVTKHQFDFHATEAHLSLVVTLDGNLQVGQASILIDASGNQGLSPLGAMPTRWKADFTDLSSKWQHVVQLRGQTHPKQTEIRLRLVTVTAAGIVEEEYPIALPDRMPSSPLRPYPDVLEEAYRRLISEVFQQNHGVVVLGIEDSFGAEMLVSKMAAERNAVRRSLDLDLYHSGIDGNSLWDGAQLLGYLSGVEDADAVRPVVVYPCDLFIRKVSEERRQIFRQFIESLEGRINDRNASVIVLVLPLELAFELDGILSDGARRVWAHRAPRREELVEWMEHQGIDREKARAVTVWCDNDLRYVPEVMRFLGSSTEDPRTASDWKLQCKEVRNGNFEREISSLHVGDLALILAVLFGRTTAPQGTFDAYLQKLEGGREPFDLEYPSSHPRSVLA